MRQRELVVFLGPSLPAAEARRLARCTVLPPARQGDIWRALARRPAALALIDGVFESTPSVWHHELLDALDAGVAVFGGASMGALRAVELAPHGMVGVGRIFGWFRDGVLTGDDEVALLHAPAEAGYLPLTLPLVNVRAAAELARERGVASPRESRAVIAAGASIFYQERTWPTVLEAAAPQLRPASLAGLRALVRGAPPDPKAEDARATITAASAFVRSGVPARAAEPRRRPSSLVRRRKLADALAPVGLRTVATADVLAALAQRGRGAALRDEGLRRALLAAFGRSLGLSATAAERAAAADHFFAAQGVVRSVRRAHLAASGLDDADAARLFEDLAVEQLLLDRASRAVPDGPSAEEGLALGARLSGDFARMARRLAGDLRKPARPRRIRRS
ncbi:MAG TPA: TfuA-like protein [Anaeromyxobacteraceae bacterium]|nr:TfuA-like protein [Anaeromyxobacteraceae bacterium]